MELKSCLPLWINQLLANNPYFGPINYDERAFQHLMSQQLPDTFTTLIVGSSRTMSLSGSCIDGPSYNASVSGAMLSDITTIIEQFRRGRRLRHIILTAEPWMLNAREQSASWTTSPSVPNLIRIQAAPDWIRAQLRLGLTPHVEDIIAAGRATLEPIRQLLDPSVRSL